MNLILINKTFFLFYRVIHNACETFRVSERNKEMQSLQKTVKRKTKENFFLFLSSMRKRGIYMRSQ